MLAVKGVTKRFGDATALDGVSFTLERGRVLAAIGANGAGKTTLIKCVLGLLHYQGQITVGEFDVARNGKAARRLIGYLPQSPAFHDDLSVRETAVFYADLKGAAQKRASEVVDAAGLAEHAEKRVGALSGGMRQRLALALTLLANPPLLILDEPASSLDIAARLELRKLVQEQSKTGTAVLVSTHWLEDVPHIADDALVLDQGKAVFLGRSSDLVERGGPGSRLYLRLNGHSPEAVPLIQTIAMTGAVQQSGDWLVVSCRTADKAKVIEALVGAKINILDFRVEEAPVDAALLGLQTSNGGN